MQRIIAAELRDASGQTIPSRQGWTRAALSLRQNWRVTGLFADTPTLPTSSGKW